VMLRFWGEPSCLTPFQHNVHNYYSIRLKIIVLSGLCTIF
jgi:hypothetical protein